MAVGDFEREFMAAAGTQGIDLEPAAGLSWLSGLGHTEPEAESAPPPVLEQLAALHNALGGSYEFLLGKRRRELPVDFTLSGRVVVELDEFQHFTSSRLTSLDYYDDFDHDLDIPQYRRLCSRNLAHADAYRRTKQAVDFPFPGGRTAQRAYFDACRDLLGPAFGYRVIRIPAPSRNVMAAVAALREALEA